MSLVACIVGMTAPLLFWIFPAFTSRRVEAGTTPPLVVFPSPVVEAEESVPAGLHSYEAAL